MKDNLFEMLLSLFETSLSQLQENHKPSESESSDAVNEEEQSAADEQVQHFKFQEQTSTRVFTYDEQVKLTKASYQFLMRMRLWKVIDDRTFEQIMDQVQFSDSRVVTLQETKWLIRSVMSSDLTEEQIAFLDMILYQAEDELTIH